MRKILAIGIIGVLGGCGTSNPDAPRYAYQAARDYYNQPTNTNILDVQTQEGGSFEWKVSGPASVKLNTPVPQKNIIPKDPGVLNTAIQWLGRIGLGYFIGEAFTSAMDTRVVQQPPAPEPLVVRPEVIQVPMAP